MQPPVMCKKYNRLELLKLIYLSREADRREGLMLRQGKGWFQVSGAGHEALAAIALLMEPDDYLFPYYRDRALALARGVPLSELASAYFGKVSSSSAGRQMPAHYSDRSHHIWSALTPTGSNCLPACGVAWSLQLDSRPNVVVATIGDAAIRQGEFAESISFAVERQLPIVFVVEDNNYGISTPTGRLNPFNLGVFGDQYVVSLDARHPDRVHAVMQPILNRARHGQGPSVVLAHLDRLCSHTSSDDQRLYRSPEELEAIFSRDPIEQYSRELIEAGELTAEQWLSIQSAIQTQVDQAYQAAEAEVDPSPHDLLIERFGDSPRPAALPPDVAGKTRMVDSLNSLFRAALRSNDRVIFFGEDIQSPKGGVFGLTAGLSDDFPDRVFNAPLAEATIAGIGIGMASYGMRPIFEFQFVDFIGPALNQLLQNAASLRWRSNGDWRCPAIFYAPYGAYLPAGAIWHSQANEAIFAHTPGLRVVVPSTPEDAVGLMWSALHTDDPTIFLVPKHLLRQTMKASEQAEPVDWNQARVRRQGDQVTLVSWGNCMELALAAADQLADQLSVEVIDLRSLQPWDRACVANSLAKTGHLVVVQEDGRSCSVGQMIISDLVAETDSFYRFAGPPQLVSKEDVNIGFNPAYEFAALPDLSRIVTAIYRTLEE